MKFNHLLNAIMRGEWSLNLDVLSGYAPIVERIMQGEVPAILTQEVNKDALVSVYDKTNAPIRIDEKNQVPKGAVAVIDMEGVLLKHGDMCSYGASDIVRALDMVDKNPNFIGSVLNVNGPGGAVSALGLFDDFATYRKKPVVALCDMCCSAHYYSVLSVADHVMAGTGLSAAFGSVGVVFSFRDNKEMLEKMGYKIHEIYAPESEDKNLPVRLALEGKYDMIKEEMLSPLAKMFQAKVREKRPNLKEEKGVLTGKVYYAQDALRLGMIDSIGTFNQALEKVRVLSELKSL